MANTYRLGDKLVLIADAHPSDTTHQYLKGDTYTVKSDTPRGDFGKFAGGRLFAVRDDGSGAYLGITFEDGSETKWHSYFKPAFNAGVCVVPAQEQALGRMEKPQAKACTCASRDLFNKGCQCGAVAQRKWGI
jgi:hypothetical protein